MQLLFFTAVFTSIAEIATFCSVGFMLCRGWNTTFAEAVSYAVVTTLMLLSLLFQMAMVSGLHGLLTVVEIVLLAVSAGFLWRRRSQFGRESAAFFAFWKANPLAVSAIALGLVYMVALALSIPPDAAGCKQLNQIVYLRDNGIWAAPAASHGMPAFFPFNHAALAYMFLRFDTDVGVNLFGLMAYVSIAGSTYALARRYAWPPTALTVSLIVLSMPRMVYQATTPGGEIVPVAVGLFCLLAVYRIVERLNINELLLLVVGIAFAVSGEKAELIFPTLVLVLAWVLLVRRHGSVTLLSLVSGYKARTLAAILPLLLFSQVWLVAINVAHGNDWLGSQAAFGPFYNQDGLQGALANAVRYTLESIHLTLPAELFCSRVLGFSPIELLQWLYGLLPGYLDGTAGATEPFAITWAPGGSQSWFGPFGFLLIFPAMVYAILRGPRRLKAVAVALTGYCYLVSLVYAWSPGNARLFSLFFGCAGFSTAFLLPPWRLSLRGKRVLQIMCIILFFYALTCNTARPLFRMGTPAANTGFRLFE